VAQNITDQINSATQQEIQRAAFGLLDSIQGIQPVGHQVHAVSFLFLLMCQRFKQDPREVLLKTGAALTESLSQGRGEYTRAIINYIKDEI